MLTSKGILRNHYSLVFPAQLISDRTKYKRKPSGKFKEKKRKRSHDSQSGPKTKKRKRQREDSNEMPDSSSSERSVCETGQKTTVKRTPVAQARVTSKRPPRGGAPSCSKNLDALQWPWTTARDAGHCSRLPLYLQTRRILILHVTRVPAKEFIDIDISGLGRNSDSDMWTFRNCDVETFEIQTGDIKNPPNRASIMKLKALCWYHGKSSRKETSSS